METKKIKECDICKNSATILCFDCLLYYCDEDSNFHHQKESNKNHKIEKIDEFVPIEFKCPEHSDHPLSLFCLEEKGNNNFY